MHAWAQGRLETEMVHCSSKYGGGEDAEAWVSHTLFRAWLTSTQGLLSGHLDVRGAQPASRGRMVREIEGSPNFAAS